MAGGERPLTDRIVVSPDVCNGKPRVAGTRVLVSVVLDLLAGGKSIPDITSDAYFPDLSAADVLACIAFKRRAV